MASPLNSASLPLCRKPLGPDRLSKLEEAAARVLGRSMSVTTPRVADAAAGLLHLVQPDGGTEAYSGSPPSVGSASDLTTETDLGDSPDDDSSDADFMVQPLSQPPDPYVFPRVCPQPHDKPRSCSCGQSREEYAAE